MKMSHVEQANYDEGISHIIDAFRTATEAYYKSSSMEVKNLVDGLCTTMEMGLPKLLPRASDENKVKYNAVIGIKAGGRGK